MHDSVAHALRDWQSFYVLTGGVAATLAGLLFLAIQFGIDVRFPAGIGSALETFVAPAFLRFVHVLFIAGLALVPTETNWSLGVLLLLPTPVNTWSLYVVVHRSLQEYEPAELRLDHWILNVAVPALVYLLLVVASVSLLFQLSWALTVLGAGTLCLLLIALLNSWQMMVWITRRKTAGDE